MSSEKQGQGGNAPLRTVALLAPWVDRHGVARNLAGKQQPEGRLYVVGSRLQLPEEDAGQLENERRAVWAPAPKTGSPTTEPREQVEGDTVEGAINLNTSSMDELRNAIKGVGKKTAGDIIASREADGPFESLEDAAERVGGVSLEQLQAAGVTL